MGKAIGDWRVIRVIRVMIHGLKRAEQLKPG